MEQYSLKERLDAQRNVITNFPDQFAFTPVLENASRLETHDKFIVCGMGGSHLSAGILRTLKPTLDLLVHKNYGLPTVPEYFLDQSLIVLSSYSGSTAEVLDAAETGLRQNRSLAVIAAGGPLLDFAKTHTLPYIKLPELDIEPRFATGYATVALATLLGEKDTAESLASRGKNTPMLGRDLPGVVLATIAGGALAYQADPT